MLAKHLRATERPVLPPFVSPASLRFVWVLLALLAAAIWLAWSAEIPVFLRGRGDAGISGILTSPQPVTNYIDPVAGIVVRKFYLHLSQGEQKKRFLARLDRAEADAAYSPRTQRARS